ncbi:hypothetical protein BsWGS_05564 [Bradybaena similaris]
MATNAWTALVFLDSVVLLCGFCTSDVLAHIPYRITFPRQSSRSSDLPYLLRFESHAHSRLPRQSGSGNDGVNADTATNSGAGGQTLPDQSSQPVAPEPTTSNRNVSTTLAVPTTTLAPRDSTTVAKAGTSQKTTSHNGPPDEDTTTDLFDEPDIIHDHHKYYTSDIISKNFTEYWVELENAPRHETLSSSHRVAAVFSLKFGFYFYGHKVTNVTVATGGFLYMSPFLHQWLTATQYIAPLMANFDPSFSAQSSIYVQSEDNRFIAEWKNVVLKDQNTTGRFHFQAILQDDSTIKFLYKSVPFSVKNISNEEHPVKVGVSDAYYNDTYIPESNIKRRTIYEYHKVALPLGLVTTETVIILKPLPTCNRLTDCATCVVHLGVQFDCKWCNTLGRCSDRLDWYRQHWDREGCQNSHTTDAKICSSLPPPPRHIADPLRTSFIEDPCSDGKCSKKSEFPVAVIVIVIVIICGLLAGLAGWVYYAYTHPTSGSGMWLMEHRPSQIKSRIKFWKSNSDAGTKYKVESEA